MKNIQSNISKELVSLLTSPAFECGINGKIITTYYPWNLHGITDDPDPLLDIHSLILLGAHNVSVQGHDPPGDRSPYGE